MKTLTSLLAALLLLPVAGCGSSGSDGSDGSDAAGATSTSAPSAPATSSEPTRAGAVVDIVIKDGKVTPQGDRVDVKKGEPVTLNITSDADEEIHVHSDPEHSYEVAPGETVSESFTLDTPGQVAVEAHHLDVTIVQLVVRP